MTTRLFLSVSLLACCVPSGLLAQDVPPPPAAPDVGPSLSAPPSNGGPYAAPAAQGQYAAPQNSYAPQGGAYQQYVAPANGAPADPSQGAYQPPPGGYAAPPGQYPAPPPGTYPPGAYPPGAYSPGAYPAQPAPVMVVPEPYPYYPRHHPYGPPIVLMPAPPLSESKWSVAIEALFLERDSGGSVPLGFSVYNRSTGLPPAVPTDKLYSDDEAFPLEAGVRLEINHQITDYVTLSATYWGLQQWSVGNTIYGDPDNFTVLNYSPYLQLPTLLNGLDNSLGYTYASQIENVEFNALFRLSRDNSYWHLDWLWGARYVNFSDQFTLTGIDSFNSAREDLKYSTSNNLLGVQTGLLFVQGWQRFQWEAGIKAGLMVNMYRQHGTDTASDPGGTPAGFTPFDVSANGSSLAGLFEVSLAAKYRLTDELWLRIGYQFYDITGVALAPKQMNGWGHGGNVALDGLSIGLQYAW